MNRNGCLLSFLWGQREKMGFERKREKLSLPTAHMSTLGINLYRDAEGSQENVLTI